MVVLAEKADGTKIVPISSAVYTAATAKFRCWKYEGTDLCFLFVLLLKILPQELLNSLKQLR